MHHRKLLLRHSALSIVATLTFTTAGLGCGDPSAAPIATYSRTGQASDGGYGVWLVFAEGDHRRVCTDAGECFDTRTALDDDAALDLVRSFLEETIGDGHERADIATALRALGAYEVVSGLLMSARGTVAARILPGARATIAAVLPEVLATLRHASEAARSDLSRRLGPANVARVLSTVRDHAVDVDVEPSARAALRRLGFVKFDDFWYLGVGENQLAIRERHLFEIVGVAKLERVVAAIERGGRIDLDELCLAVTRVVSTLVR